MSGLIFQLFSKTGTFIYDDSFRREEGDVQGRTYHTEYRTLNELAAIPFLGTLFGLIRVIVAIAHTCFHAYQASNSSNSKNARAQHEEHAAKGAWMILRGAIEMIPIFGSIPHLIAMAVLNPSKEESQFGFGKDVDYEYFHQK